jgi:hypothetical protein
MSISYQKFTRRISSIFLEETVMKCKLLDALSELVQAHLYGYSDLWLIETAHKLDGVSVEIAGGVVKRELHGVNSDAPEVGL